MSFSVCVDFRCFFTWNGSYLLYALCCLFSRSHLFRWYCPHSSIPCFLPPVFIYFQPTDPDTSPTAHYVSHTLPDKFLKLAGKLMGQKAVKVIETFMEKLLAIIYLTVIIGGYATVVLHGFPKARESPHIPNYHLNVSYGVFFFALYTWRLTMTTRYVVFGVFVGAFFWLQFHLCWRLSFFDGGYIFFSCSI